MVPHDDFISTTQDKGAVRETTLGAAWHFHHRETEQLVLMRRWTLFELKKDAHRR